MFTSDGGSPRFEPPARYAGEDATSAAADTPFAMSLFTPSATTLHGSESPASRANRRRLVHVGSTCDSTPDAAAATLVAGRSITHVVAEAADGQVDESILKLLGDTTTSTMPPSSLTSRPSWRVSGGLGAGQTPTKWSPGPTTAARSPQQLPHGHLSHYKDRMRPLALGAAETSVSEDGATYLRSRGSSVVVLEDTQVVHVAATPNSAGATTPLTRLPSASPRPPPLGLHPPLQGLLPSPGSPGLLQRQASWRSAGSACRTSNHTSGSIFVGTATQPGAITPPVAPVASPSEAAPSLFPTSNWIKATLNGTATRPRRRTESSSPSPAGPAAATSATPTPTPPKRALNSDKAAAEAATQLHERRVAAALQSQREMREFTAIMRRVEAEGGGNALRHQRHDKKRHVWAAAVAAAGESGQRRRPQSGAGSRSYQPAGIPPPLASRGLARTSSGAGDADESPSAARHDGDGDVDARSSDAFSEEADAESDEDEDDADDVGVTATHGTSGARIGGGGGGLGRAAAADLEAAENMSRVGLYKVRDRTARGWVVLQRRRLAHLRAGTPTLERQMRASHQRLQRANRDATAMERDRLRKSAAEDAAAREAARATIAAAAAASGIALPGTSASSLHLSGAMAEDLATLTVSWSGLRSPEKRNTGEGSREQLQLQQDDAEAVAAAAAPASRRVARRGTDGEGNSGGCLRISVPAVDDAAAAAEDADPLHRHSGSNVSDGVTAAGEGSSNTSESSTFDMLSAHRASLRTAVQSTSDAGVGDASTGPDAAGRSGVVSVTHVMGAAIFTAAEASLSAMAGATETTAEEQQLRLELQRLLGLANECALYGLQRSLRGTGDDSTGKPPRQSTPGSATPVAVPAASLVKGAAPSALDNKGSGGGAASEGGTGGLSASGSRGPSPQLSPRRLRPHEAGTGVAGASAHATEPAASAAGTPSASTSLPALGNSCTPPGPTRTRAAVAHIVSPLPPNALDRAPAAEAERAPPAPPQSRPTRRARKFTPAKRAGRRKPLPAASGVGEHAAVLLQHELLLTRRAELEADQSHSRDIDGACAMLQRLRPLREQLMELDICQGRQRSEALAAALAGEGGGATGGGVKGVSGGPRDPLLLTRGPAPARGSGVGSGVLTVGATAEARAAAAAMAAAALTREAAKDASAGRSHMPQAVLQRHRQLIYEEAARLDSLNRLEARRGYLEVLMQLARRHVSTISWPAVSALLAEAQERLARETQLTATASPTAGAGGSGQAQPPPPQWLPGLGKFSGSLSATTPATPALPYGGLQHLIATHLGILELTQWPVQEVLQHLAALYQAPLSLLHEWIAEQQRRQSHSYNYDERFRAIDRTIVGRTVTADTVLRLTLHRCRRPPLAPLRSASRANTATGGRRSELMPDGERDEEGEEGLYFVRVRSAVHTASSTAVPLSSAGAAAALGGGDGGGAGGGGGDGLTRSLSAMGGNPFASGSFSLSGAAAASSSSSPSPSSAKTLSFLGQTLVLHLRSPSVTGGAGKGDRPGMREAEGDPGDAVLLVELLQAGTSPTLLASGELDLRVFGFNPYRSHANGGSRVRAQVVTISLKSKGYRSAELKATVEVL